MVRVVKAQEKLKKKPGRPNNLKIENQILLTLQYWREYRTYVHTILYRACKLFSHHKDELLQLHFHYLFYQFLLYIAVFS